MLKRILHRRTAAFERASDYDAAYMHELIDIDPKAAMPPEVVLSLVPVKDGSAA